jgi:hypothetical protein
VQYCAFLHHNRANTFLLEGPLDGSYFGNAR